MRNLRIADAKAAADAIAGTAAVVVVFSDDGHPQVASWGENGRACKHASEVLTRVCAALGEDADSIAAETPDEDGEVVP